MKPLLHVYVPFIGKQRNDDGTLTVTGKVAGPDLDGDKQVMNEKWLEGALPEWFRTGANVREQHQQIAAGVGTELTRTGDDWFLKSTIVDPVTIAKIEHKVINGYSAGIRNGQVYMKSARAPRGEIVGGDIVEVSVVDRGSNPTCKLTFAKATDGGELLELDDAEYVVFDEASKSWVPDPDITKASGNPFADKGPKKESITDAASLKAAIKAAMKVPVALRKGQISHIKARAKALKLDVPDSLDKTAIADLTKASPAEYTANINAVLAGLASLIAAEASELADGDDERCDISQLLNAVYAVWCFWESESSEGEVPAPTGRNSMTDINLAAVADLFKSASADDATDEQKAELAAVLKAAGIEPEAEPDPTTEGSLDKAAVAEIVKSAVEEATKPFKDELETIKKSAAPGGPVKTRTELDTTKASSREIHLAEVTRLTKSADLASDRTMAEGMRALARDHQARADDLLK